MKIRKSTGLLLVAAVLIFVGACSTNTAQQLAPTRAVQATEEHVAEIGRNPDVPNLPFADNPDPALCGIPQPWHSDEPAYLSGMYQGELIQPSVYLYDSHLRREVVGQVPHGSPVKIILSQSNPSLDYFLVKAVDAAPPVEGWVPAPFISIEPPPNN